MGIEAIKITLILAALIIVSVFASKLTSKFGIPILLIFIFMGMLSGSDGIGGISFTNIGATQLLGTIALICILFSGGLATKVEEIKPVWKEGALLASLGVILSTAVMTLLIHWYLEWDWVSCALLSATVSSTDAAAVFGIFLTQKMNLKPRMEKLLELESGANDPLAVFLTVTLITISKSPTDLNWVNLSLTLVADMAIGALVGWVLSRGMVYLINFLDLDSPGLYPVLSMAGVMCIYCLSEYFHGNGFLSVYIAGLTMGQEKYFSKRTLTVFHDGLSWIMQSAMFLLLGLLVFPSDLPKIMLPGVMISLLLMFIGRPLSVWICILPFKYNWREFIFLTWGGLRGAVPVILATYVLAGDVKKGHDIFNLVFFIVLISMMFQGSTMKWLAKVLKLTQENITETDTPFHSERIGRDFHSFHVPEKSSLIGKSVFELNLPEEVLIVLVSRSNQDFIPNGNTELEAHDRVICLCSKRKQKAVRKIFHQ